MFERAIVEAAARLRDAGEAHVIATVVRVSGSAYRRPGARMLIAGARTVGAVSGGCLEDDLVAKAWWRTESGPALITYDSTATSSPDPDEARAAYRLGCGGVVEILVERARPTSSLEPLAIAARCARTQRRAAVATVFRSDAPGTPIGTRIAIVDGQVKTDSHALPGVVHDEILAVLRGALERGRTGSLTFVTPIGALDVLVEAIRPPPRVFVFGAGHDVIPVVQLSRALGWNVVLCAKRARTAMLDGIATTDEVVIGPPSAIADRLAGADRAYAIVMNHSLDDDRECLAMLLDARIDYIGVLGPRRRTEQLLASLGRTDRDPRLHAPVGLELGAETPAEIALAIAGEIQATIVGASAARLRDRPQAIHQQLTAASLV